jgi:hypothetical protein
MVAAVGVAVGAAVGATDEVTGEVALDVAAPRAELALVRVVCSAWSLAGSAA